MRQGRRIVPEVQWAIVHISRMLDHDQISTGLDVSLTTINVFSGIFKCMGQFLVRKRNQTLPVTMKILLANLMDTFVMWMLSFY
ncbi:hypothetical protein PAXRUDRAFT_772071 [Paxillus rubicundulus Ve08.2h10]|uniref:Uncharacterized protein n=1 Tax=Paxillus rubicundulus Ve08.2h10 TaxID=930991 RepID=A0A0D0C6J5_9AGAM|nr:hypothetical protein PAXRUDRAFT_772071 [Paxillus rubicundulus Ve08.2h10]